MKLQRSIVTALGILIGLCIASVTHQSSASSGNTKDITFNKDVAPILYRKCSTCHHPNGGAKLPLLSYRDARPWARSIKDMAISHEMPPREADQLSQQEIDTIVAWVNQGAREGNTKDLPPLPILHNAANPANKLGIPEQLAPRSDQLSLQSDAPALMQNSYDKSAIIQVTHMHAPSSVASHGAAIRFDADSFSFDPVVSFCNHKAITLPIDNLLEVFIVTHAVRDPNDFPSKHKYKLYDKGARLPLPAMSELKEGWDQDIRFFGGVSLFGFSLYVKARKPGNTKDTLDFEFTDTNTVIGWGSVPTHISEQNFQAVIELASAFQRSIQQNVFAKQNAVRREAARLEAERRALPADLKTSVKFDDSQSVMPTGRLEAGKKTELVITINNQGQGPAYDVALVVSADNPQVVTPAPASLGEIAPGQSRELRVPLEAPLTIPSGELNVDVEARERRGYNARKVRVIIPMLRLEKPVLSIENVLIEDGTLGLAKGNGNKIMESGETIELIVLVKNSGNGPAATEVTLSSTDAAIEVLQRSASLGVIQPHQVAQGKLAIALPRTYSGNRVSLNLQVTDRRGEGVASASRQFVFDVLSRIPQLAIHARILSHGVEVQTLSNDQTVDLEITPENTGKLEALDVTIRASAPEVILQQAQARIGLLRAGEKGIPERFTLTLPRAFIKDRLPIQIELAQKDFPGQTLVYEVPVKPQQPTLSYRFNVVGRLGGADIEQNETAGLEVQVSNNGGLLAKDVQASIDITQSGVVIQGEKSIQLGAIAPAGQSVARFKIRALRSVPPGALAVQLQIAQADFPALAKTILLNVREEQPDVNKVDKPDAPVAPPVRHKPTIVLAQPRDGETVRGRLTELIGTVVDQKGVSRVDVTVNGKPLPEEVLRQGLKRRASNDARALDQTDFIFPLPLEFGVNEVRIAAFNNENESAVSVFTVARLEDNPSGPTAATALVPLSDVDRYILSAEAVRPNSRRWAVIIGIEQYRKVAAVPFASRDAYAMREYATKVLGVPAGQVYLLTDDQATKAEMMLLLEERLQEKVQSGDTVFVYFAGHGIPDVREGAPYLVPADGDPQSPRITCYALDDFYTALGKLKAENVVVFLDACFSGMKAREGNTDSLFPGARGVIKVKNPVLRYRNLTSFAAAGSNEVSNAYKQEAHGLFTYFLLKGLGGAVNPKDGKLRLSDVAAYVKEQVSQVSRHLFGENLHQSPFIMPELDSTRDVTLK